MNRHVKCALLAGAAWGVLAGASVAQDSEAAAQAANANQDTATVDDIVVTARRRDEQLKDVPIAVSALSAERLEQTGAVNITALQQQTPNATVQIARGSNSTLISFIRGVGQQDPLWGFEPGVGLYVDDVYVARPQGAVLDIFDVSRIEVLRGPQGTLYGRNTIGGAIKYVTKRLGNDPSLTARAEVGAYNEHNFLLSGSAPVGQTFAIGGAVATYQHDGYGKNLNTGQDQYDKDVTAYRASAEWTPNDNLFFRLAWDRVEDDSSPRHGHREVTSSDGLWRAPAGKYDTYAGITGEQKVVTEGVALTGDGRLMNSGALTGLSKSNAIKRVVELLQARDGDGYVLRVDLRLRP